MLHSIEEEPLDPAPKEQLLKAKKAEDEEEEELLDSAEELEEKEEWAAYEKAEDLLKKARKSFHEKQEPEAIKYYKTILSIGKEQKGSSLENVKAKAAYMLGNIYANKKDHKQVKENMEMAIQYFKQAEKLGCLFIDQDLLQRCKEKLARLRHNVQYYYPRQITLEEAISDCKGIIALGYPPPAKLLVHCYGEAQNTCNSLSRLLPYPSYSQAEGEKEEDMFECFSSLKVQYDLVDPSTNHLKKTMILYDQETQNQYKELLQKLEKLKAEVEAIVKEGEKSGSLEYKQKFSIYFKSKQERSQEDLLELKEETSLSEKVTAALQEEVGPEDKEEEEVEEVEVEEEVDDDEEMKEKEECAAYEKAQDLFKKAGNSFHEKQEPEAIKYYETILSIGKEKKGSSLEDVKAKAAYRLGKIYANKKDHKQVKENMEMAIKYFKQAEKLGCLFIDQHLQRCKEKLELEIKPPPPIEDAVEEGTTNSPNNLKKEPEEKLTSEEQEEKLARLCHNVQYDYPKNRTFKETISDCKEILALGHSPPIKLVNDCYAEAENTCKSLSCLLPYLSYPQPEGEKEEDMFEYFSRLKAQYDLLDPSTNHLKNSMILYDQKTQNQYKELLQKLEKLKAEVEAIVKEGEKSGSLEYKQKFSIYFKSKQERSQEDLLELKEETSLSEKVTAALQEEVGPSESGYELNFEEVSASEDESAWESGYELNFEAEKFSTYFNKKDQVILENIFYRRGEYTTYKMEKHLIPLAKDLSIVFVLARNKGWYKDPTKAKTSGFHKYHRGNCVHAAPQQLRVVIRNCLTAYYCEVKLEGDHASSPTINSKKKKAPVVVMPTMKKSSQNKPAAAEADTEEYEPKTSAETGEVQQDAEKRPRTPMFPLYEQKSKTAIEKRKEGLQMTPQQKKEKNEGKTKENGRIQSKQTP